MSRRTAYVRLPPTRKQVISDDGPSSSKIPEAESPMSTISSILKDSPSGKRLIQTWIKVLEKEKSHDATYYYKNEE